MLQCILWEKKSQLSSWPEHERHSSAVEVCIGHKSWPIHGDPVPLAEKLVAAVATALLQHHGPMSTLSTLQSMAAVSPCIPCSLLFFIYYFLFKPIWHALTANKRLFFNTEKRPLARVIQCMCVIAALLPCIFWILFWLEECLFIPSLKFDFFFITTERR